MLTGQELDMESCTEETTGRKIWDTGTQKKACKPGRTGGQLGNDVDEKQLTVPNQTFMFIWDLDGKISRYDRI
jgi:hypothetical protein